MTNWVILLVVAVWTLLALTWLAVLVPLAGQGQGQARQLTDDSRGEAPATDTNTTQTND